MATSSRPGRYASTERLQEAYYGDIKCQTMRLEMIHQWRSASGAQSNIIRLTKYIGGAKNSYWRLVRIYRARIIVNSAYTWLMDLDSADGKRVHQLLTRYMRTLDRERDKVLSRRGWDEQWVAKPWNWTKTYEKAKALKQGNPGLFDTLRRNIEGKAYNNPNFDASRMRTNIALAKLVRTLRDVEFDQAA